MIRTLIEVTADDDWQHRKQLEAALDKLGFEPKRSAESGAFQADLRSALAEKNLEAWVLVEEYRGRMRK